MTTMLSAATARVRAIDFAEISGRVSAVSGGRIEVEGLGRAARVGARLSIELSDGEHACAEIIAANRDVATALTYEKASGAAPGARVKLFGSMPMVAPCEAWLGRVVDGLGRPADGGCYLPHGDRPRLVHSGPPPASARARLGVRLETGVSAVDIFTPLCEGQRLGLFSGSGVGKSVLLAMLARHADCDVFVIGLIGERGREVREFIEDELGPEGLARAVMVTATSDESALMRRESANMTLAIAEHFRDEGQRVFCLMDSVTRFAQALREIGLAAGEPPTTKGYTPSVFAELPRLLERAGPGAVGAGTITGLFSVLVEGGDMDEPVADAVRGTLDGHVVLSRTIAERGRFPAVDVLKSLSRSLPGAHSDEEYALLTAARAELSAYGDMEELIRLGAYKEGSSASVDQAITRAPQIEELLTQTQGERRALDDGFARLAAILS